MEFAQGKWLPTPKAHLFHEKPEVGLLGCIHGLCRTPSRDQNVARARETDIGFPVSFKGNSLLLKYNTYSLFSLPSSPSMFAVIER